MRMGMGFFFSSRRRHTRYIGDWSSDVCSSDLLAEEGCAVVYISHRLEEVKHLCHNATILRHGKVVANVDPTRETAARSEERRVGKECRSRWTTAHKKNKKITKITHRPKNKNT